jgi:four helix bundle protein
VGGINCHHPSTLPLRTLALRVHFSFGVGAQTHRGLAAWRLADEVRQSVILICRKDPASRDRAYCGQALTASGSACRNIAEGFARYRHADFARFVTMAYASLVELEDILDEGHHRGFVAPSEYDIVLTQILRAKRAANGLRRYLQSTPTPPEHLRIRPK